METVVRLLRWGWGDKEPEALPGMEDTTDLDK